MLMSNALGLLICWASRSTIRCTSHRRKTNSRTTKAMPKSWWRWLEAKSRASLREEVDRIYAKQSQRMSRLKSRKPSTCFNSAILMPRTALKWNLRDLWWRPWSIYSATGQLTTLCWNDWNDGWGRISSWALSLSELDPAHCSRGRGPFSSSSMWDQASTNVSWRSFMLKQWGWIEKKYHYSQLDRPWTSQRNLKFHWNEETPKIKRVRKKNAHPAGAESWKV